MSKNTYLSQKRNRSWVGVAILLAASSCGDDGGPSDSTSQNDAGSTADTTDTKSNMSAALDAGTTASTTSSSTKTTGTGSTTATSTTTSATTTSSATVVADSGTPSTDTAVPDAAMTDTSADAGATEGSSSMMDDGGSEMTTVAMTDAGDAGQVDQCLTPTAGTAMEDCYPHYACDGDLMGVCVTYDEGVFNAVLDCYATNGFEETDCSTEATQQIYSCLDEVSGAACLTEESACATVGQHCTDFSEAECNEMAKAYNSDTLTMLVGYCIDYLPEDNCATTFATYCLGQ